MLADEVRRLRACRCVELARRCGRIERIGERLVDRPAEGGAVGVERMRDPSQKRPRDGRRSCSIRLR